MNPCNYQPLTFFDLSGINYRFRGIYRELCYLRSSSGGGQNISNASLTANGNYTHDWAGHQFDITGIDTFILKDETNLPKISFTSSATNLYVGGDDLLFADAAGTTLKAVGNDLLTASSSTMQLKVLGNNVINASSSLTNISVNGESSDYFNILSGGNVGIGTSTPTSTLHVNGSVNLKVNVIADADYTVLDTDYMISCKNWTSDWTVTLPTGVTGRTLIFVPSPSANDYRTFFSADVVDEQRIGHDNIRSSSGGTITIMYDGADWQVVTNTKAW